MDTFPNPSLKFLEFLNSMTGSMRELPYASSDSHDEGALPGFDGLKQCAALFYIPSKVPALYYQVDLFIKILTCISNN
jgi:hypothetical protein